MARSLHLQNTCYYGKAAHNVSIMGASPERELPADTTAFGAAAVKRQKDEKNSIGMMCRLW